MNNEVVYVKTGEGEAAMHQRTRLVQRNLRMVLILVDGHSSVAELKKKMTDQSIVEPSLEELARMGLIEPLESRIEREAPVPEVISEPSSGSTGWEEDLDSILPPDALDTPQIGRVEDEPEVFTAESRGVRTGEEAPAVVAPPAVGGVKGLLAKVRQAREERAFEKAYRDDGAEDEIRLKPVRRGGGRSIVTWVVGGVLAVLLALVSIVVAYPYGRHLPQVEKALEVALGEPVKIASMGFAMAPYPHISLNQISVGSSGAATADLVRISPSFGSLLLFSLVPKKVDVVGVHLKVDSLGRVARWFGGSGVVLRDLSFSGLDVDVGGVSMGGYHGEVVFTPEGRMARVSLKNESESLSLEAEPRGGVFFCSLTGHHWQLPFNRGIDIEFFDGKGEIGSEGMKLTQLEAKVFDGLVAATADLSWSGDVSVSGRGEMRGLSLAKLASAISPALSANGVVNGILRVDTGSGRLNQLARSAVIRGGFEVQRGSVNRFDIVEALRSTGRIPTRGGKTSFEHLGGMIEIAGGGGRISGLQLVSGLLGATGEVRLDAGETLSGRLEAELKGTAGQRAPLAVTGTLSDPQLNVLRGGR
ncbi:MAG: hypothetical protein EG825_09040 [Rhodocyclaceae bacterium]|nr:hypothetical protein [Rhodocyclaceae bacterium]